MPPPKRAKEDILAVMLIVLSIFPGKSIYFFMDKVNTSHTQFKRYFELLQWRKLIAREADGVWVVTDKGKQYLKAYEQMMQILGKDAETENLRQRLTEA